MSRWQPCASEDCDQLARDHDECDDCREARTQHRRKTRTRDRDGLDEF